MANSDSPEKTLLLLSADEPVVQEVKALIGATFPDLTLKILPNGIDGLASIYQCPPGVIIIDAALPDISGIQVCRVLKQDPTLQKLPLLCITHDHGEAYQRLSELAPIADAFVPRDKLDHYLAIELEVLFNIFKGLDESEKAQISFLQNQSVEVDATTRMVQLLDQAITEDAVMKSFNRLFELIPNRDVLTHLLFSLLENVLDYDAAAVFFNDRTREARTMSFHLPGDLTISEDTLETLTHDILDQLKSEAKEPWLFHHYRHEVLYPDKERTAKAGALRYRSVYPFMVENQLTGALVFLNRKEIAYDIIFPFPLILEEMGALMRLRHYYSEAQMLAMCDALTGLYTHQHFLWCLEREIRQAQRTKSPLSLALITIDNFRELNEQGGHALGDLAIQHASRVILDSSRSVDFFAREGSVKILGLLPNTSSENSSLVFSRIQEKIMQSPLSFKGQDVQVSLSIGLTVLTDGISTPQQLLAQAEKALEKARRKGNNSLQLLI